MDQQGSTGSSSSGQTAVQATDPPSAAVTPEELAAELAVLIDQFEAKIPNFQPHDRNDIRRVSAVARFATELVVPTIATTTSFGPAGERNLLNIERATLALRSRDALRPVIQRLAALRDGVEFTVNNALADAGGEALHVYAWAKVYAKRPDAAALHPYVSEMSKVVKKVINHRKPSSTPTPNPSGSTPAPTPTGSQLPPGAHGFLASKMVPAGQAGEDVYPDAFNEALDRAVKE
jgi:hypothetical protein